MRKKKLKLDPMATAEGKSRDLSTLSTPADLLQLTSTPFRPKGTLNPPDFHVTQEMIDPDLSQITEDLQEEGTGNSKDAIEETDRSKPSGSRIKPTRVSNKSQNVSSQSKSNRSSKRKKRSSSRRKELESGASESEISSLHDEELQPTTSVSKSSSQEDEETRVTSSKSKDTPLRAKGTQSVTSRSDDSSRHEKISKHSSSKSRTSSRNQGPTSGDKVMSEPRSSGDTKSSSNTSRIITNPTSKYKKYRYPPGMKALKEIRKYRNTTHLLIRKLSFSLLVREILMARSSTVYLMQSTALMALQESAETFIIQLFEDALLCALHARRVTLTIRDLQLARRLTLRHTAYT